MKRRLRVRGFQAALVLASQLVGVGSASAVCQQVAGLGDTALFGNLAACPTEYIEWYARAYGIEEPDWDVNGFHDPCNITREYAKHWNSSILITHGILFDLGFAGRAFHSVEDYDQVVRARDSDEWHNELRHQEVDNLSNNGFGMYADRTGLVDLLQTSCLVYNTTATFNDGTPTGIPSGDPVFRASTLVHEGWHGWKANHNISNPPANGGHRVSGPASIGCPLQTPCDDFYFHGKGDYNVLELHMEKAGHAKSHSVFQVQMEFLCDVADQPSSRVPFVNRQVAARTANRLSTTRFVNGPAFSCGSPQLTAVPIGSAPPPPPQCTGGAPPCTVSADCAPRMYCSAFSNCCEIVVN